MAWGVRIPVQIELDRRPREREDRRQRERLTEEMEKFKEVADKAAAERNRQRLEEQKEAFAKWKRERLTETREAFAPEPDALQAQEAIWRGEAPEEERLREGGRVGREFRESIERVADPELMAQVRDVFREAGIEPGEYAQALQARDFRRLSPELLGRVAQAAQGLQRLRAERAELPPRETLQQQLAATGRGLGRGYERVREIEEPFARGASEFLTGEGGFPIKLPQGAVMEVARPTNWVPIPVVDPAVARVLGLGFKLATRAGRAELRTGLRVTVSQADEVLRRAKALVARGDETIPESFVPDLEQRLAPMRGGAEVPEERVPFPEPLREPTEEVRTALERHRAGETLTPQEMALVQRHGVEVPLERTKIPEFEPVLGEMEEAQRALPRYQRDLVGEELDRLTIPTSRQVEASSKAVPPEVRAQRAAPPADVRVPMEDWTAVEARIGTRYQENWWTKIDDVIGRVMGRNRQLETDVRNVMIVKDEYIRSQGGRMRVGVLDWIGRNRRVLGLKTQGPRRGYADAVQVRPGAKIAKGLQQHLDHITEHPEKYIISEEQARALQERQDIFENVLRAEQRHGVNVDEIADAYAPRVINKMPKGQEVEVALTKVSTRYFKTRPWYTEARAIPDVEQLWAAGYRTLDPLSAMELRVATGAETIANVQALNRIKGMGYRPLERVRPQLAEELATATQEHRTARAQAVKTGSTADKTTALETEVRLDQATRDMRGEARLLAERQPKVLGRVVAPEVAKELNRYLATVPDSGVDDFLRLARASLVTTDYGSPLLQNWFTFYRDTPSWLKSFAHGASAVSDNPYAFIVDHLDSIERGIRYGAIRAPEEFLLMRGGKLSRQVGKLPIIRESQRAFEWNIFTAQTYRWEATEATAKTADELYELASVLRKQSGSNFMPGLTARQARWLTRTWFAPQFTTALQATLLDPLVKSGPARREALKTVALAFGGAAVATVAINQKLNGELPNMTDPDEAGFWGIRMPDAAGGGYVYPFGPFQPTIVALARSGRVAAATAKGEMPSTRDLQAWPRFASNKASIGVRIMMRIGEAMGLPIETLRGPSFQEPEVIRERENILQALQRELGGYAPIGAAQAYRGIREGAPITALEFGGGRTTVETPWQEMQRRRQEVMGERGITVSYEQLKRDDPHIALEIDRDPRIAELQRQLDERPPRTEEGEGYQRLEEAGLEFRSRQQQDDDNLRDFFRSGGQTEFTPQRYGELARERARELANRRDQIRQDFELEFAERIPDPGTVGAAIEGYFAVDIEDFTDPLTREVDWGPFNDAQERALSGLSAEQREGAMSVIRKNQTDIQRTFKELRDEEDMDAYWDIPPEDRPTREAFRGMHPRVDAILYITGTTTTLMTLEAQRQANALVRRIFGMRAQIPEGTLRSGTGRRQRESILPGGGRSILPGGGGSILPGGGGSILP